MLIYVRTLAIRKCASAQNSTFSQFPNYFQTISGRLASENSHFQTAGLLAFGNRRDFFFNVCRKFLKKIFWLKIIKVLMIFLSRNRFLKIFQIASKTVLYCLAWPKTVKYKVFKLKKLNFYQFFQKFTVAIFAWSLW